MDPSERRRLRFKLSNECTSFDNTNMWYISLWKLRIKAFYFFKYNGIVFKTYNFISYFIVRFFSICLSILMRNRYLRISYVRIGLFYCVPKSALGAQKKFQYINCR